MEEFRMATVLLIIIYIAFIGLGIPDSLFGTAWPAIYMEFNLPVSAANYVTFLISGGTIISSLLSARLINRYGTAKITAVSTTITAAALLGFSYSNGIFWLCLCAIPLGLGAGAIDSALNNYIALHYKAMHMNFLHCFYGIGVSLSPYLMSLALSVNANWRNGYRIVFWFQAGIAIVTIISIPLWKKVKHASSVQENSSVTLGFFQLIKMVRTVCLIFMGSCAMEYTCGGWGSTFLVNAKGVMVDTAAQMITFYYMGMALGRFLSGVFANKLTSWQLVRIGQMVVLAAIVLLLLPVPSFVSGIALFLIGLGNGPIFPNMLHLTPQNFGTDISQSVIGIQMAASYFSIMLAPMLFGFIAQIIGVTLFPYYLMVLFLIMMAGTILLKWKIKNNAYSNFRS